MSEPLVLIPGLNCTGELFRDQIAAFSGGRSCQVVRHGDYSDLRTTAGAILNLAPPRFALAGLSMGGYLAMEIMRQAPARVTRLALLDTRIAMDTAEDRERREALIGLAENDEFDKVHAALWPRLVHPDRLKDEALEAVVRGMADATGPAGFIRQQRAVIGRMNYYMTVAAIRCPTLVLVGEQDAITPVDHSRVIARLIPGSRLVVVPDCGHLSTLEQPHAVNTALLLWLQAMM